MSVETAGNARTTTVGGRSIAWTTYGDPTGTPVGYFHGAGGSRLEAAFFQPAAAAAGLRVISLDRPGSGLTDPIPGRDLLQSVADLRAVLDTEGVERAPVAGLSAGAMYAWASAHALPDRVTAVIAISPAVNVEPWADVKAAMDSRMKLMALLARRAPGLLTAVQRKQQKAFERPDGHARFVKAMRKISPDDATVLEDEAVFLDVRSASNEGRRQGHMGGEEFALLVSKWGFDPTTQSTPCTVIYGSGDPITPMIRAWLAHAPNAKAVEIPGAGHLMTCFAEGRAALLEAYAAGCA
jgi:pimeloyl-ACP methyl ester carboxylesterase